jgi:hypothetical protein
MLLRQCATLCVLGFVNDLLMTAHIQACARRNLWLSVSTIVCVCLVGFCWHQWFVESDSRWARWWLTVAGAVGAGCGTAVVILLGD